MRIYRLFFGKDKVMAVALGVDPSKEPYRGTSLLTPHLHGNVGLIFSTRSPANMLDYFASFRPSDYARAGTIASRSFSIPPGMIHTRAGEIPEDEDVPIAHSIEPSLRKLGVPTKLVKGKVMLEAEEPFVVCRDGEKLGSGQTSLLKMFGITMAEFIVGIEAWWEKTGEDGGEVTVLEDGVQRKVQSTSGGRVAAGGMEDVISDDEA